MKLPTKQPLKENIVVTSPGELQNLIKEALSHSSGAFMKIFGRDSRGKYYVTVLFDRSKVLAAECLLVDEKKDLVGSEALSVLKSLMKNPMVMDIYTLDELETKLSIADNVDVYSQTEKIPLSELFGVEVSEVAQAPKAPVEEKPAPTVAPVPKPPVEEKPPEKPEPQPPAEEKAKKPPEKVEEKVEKPAPAPKQVPKEPEVIVNFTGGKLPERAFKVYAEALLKEAKRIKNLNIYRIEFDSNLSEGVAYLNVRLYGTSDGSSRDIEIAEKRMLHAVSKHAPIILREAEVKPIVRDVAVVINGEEVKPQEIVEKDKKKTGKVTKDGKISLSVLEDVWPYFSSYARTVISEIERSGIRVDKAYFDVKGRREFEINLYAAVESNLTDEEIVGTIRTILTRHARELGRSIDRYITVHTVEIEKVSPKVSGVAPAATKGVSSAKAAEILARKEELEKEVEKLLKEAGIDELAPLTEEKKKEAEETALRSKIQPALETLRSRIHSELKLIPRVTFKWLKMNHEVDGRKLIIDVEASFLREDTAEGLFGSFSGVPEERIKQEVAETIQRLAREIGREYGIVINVRSIKVLLR
ncbi:MAG: hypothetical protein J7L37_06160 [Thermococcus sp.]|nr:hypothetical protein [Thermococcus sp.]